MQQLIVARCGDSEIAPESTLSAFEGAISKGADSVEFDAHLTRDGEIVIHHDYYLGRTSAGEGFIGNHSLDELRELDVGRWFDEAFAGERMPTLRDVLALGSGRVRFEIDMRDPSLELLERVLETIDGFGVEEDVELTSNHTPLLFTARRLRPKVHVGVFFYALPDWMGRELGEAHVMGWMRLMEATVAHLPSSLINLPFVKQLHDEGFLVHASNLNREDELQRALLAEVDQLSTSSLALALAVRDGLAFGPNCAGSA